MIKRISFIFLIANLVMVSKVFAGAKEDCLGKNVELIVLGCSAIVEAGAESPSIMIEAHYNLGYSYLNKGEYNRALSHFKGAASYNFQSENLYVGIGGAHRKLRDFQKALEAYERAIELNPKSHKAYMGIGNVYSEKGLYAQAIQKYDYSIWLTPTFSNAYLARGLAYEHLGNVAKAGADYRKALSLIPGNEQAIRGLKRLGLSHQF